MRIYEEKKDNDRKNEPSYDAYKVKYILIATGDIVDNKYFDINTNQDDKKEEFYN